MQKRTTSVKNRLWLLPSPEAVIFILIFWISLLFMPQMMNGDGDLGRHLTIGRFILDTGTIPEQDVFSHTMTGATVVSHEWLSQIGFALAHRAAGLNGVAWLTALILAVIYALLTYGMQRLGVRALVALACSGMAAVVGALHTLTRPHIFTLLLFAIFLLVIEHYRQTSRWQDLIALPLIMVAWSNIHGAFITGFVLVGFYVIGAALRKKWRRALTLVGLLAVLIVASWVNPAGPAIVGHSFGYLQERFLVNTTVEYRSPDFHSFSVMPFAALLMLSLALGWRTRRQLDWTSLVLLLGWTAFALYSARNIPLYALVAVLMVAREVDAIIDELSPILGRFLSRTDEFARASWGWIWTVLILMTFIGLGSSGMKLDLWRMGNNFDPRVFPVAAIDSLQDGLPDGPVFNEFTWGGYLLYRLWPEKQVFIDGQTDFYGEALTREYLQVVGAEPGWEEILEKYDVQWVVVPPMRPIAMQLADSENWDRSHQDETSTVWVRR